MGAESSQSTDADVSADNPTVSVVMTAAALQHQGLVRERQEDSCLAHVLTDKPAVLLVVADGMGGHQAGDIASQAAVEAVAQALLPVLNSLQPSATVRLPERDEEDEAPAQAANPLRTVSLSQATVVLSETAVAQTPQWDILLARAVQGVQNAVRSVAARIDALDNAGCTPDAGAGGRPDAPSGACRRQPRLSVAPVATASVDDRPLRRRGPGRGRSHHCRGSAHPCCGASTLSLSRRGKRVGQAGYLAGALAVRRPAAALLGWAMGDGVRCGNRRPSHRCQRSGGCGAGAD
jgi:hypothetical protein